MTVREKIYSILKGSPTVTAIVPAASIKTGGDLQKLLPPYIVHFPVSLETIITHEGVMNLRIWHNYQVSCFGRDEDEADDVAQAVISVIGNYRGNPGNAITIFYQDYKRMEFDADVKSAHVALDFKVAESL